MAIRLSTTPTITPQRMVDFIERSFSDRLTLRSVSAAVRGPPSQLGRIFQSEVGLSVHEYITRVRLDHAAHFVSSRMKIKAVALSVAYRSKKNFVPRFGHKMKEMLSGSVADLVAKAGRARLGATRTAALMHQRSLRRTRVKAALYMAAQDL